jgi:hypothetical protein
MFVVTARNIALGLYPDMAAAVASITALTDPAARALGGGACHAVYWSPRHHTTFTVVEVNPSAGPSPLFRE